MVSFTQDKYAVVAITACLMIQFLICRGAHIHSYTGTGAVYSFDPVGSYEREACRAAGAAQSLVQPFLDNQVSSHNKSTIRPERTYTTRPVSVLHPSNLSFFVDLLQKSDTSPWDNFLKTPSISHRPLPRDRFVYGCN